jgi:DNA mismatch endonuclease, patch repair protein
MADVLTPEQRHLNMSRIRGRDTKPELMLRHGLHRRGLRFRLHRKDLPGRPDMIFPRYRAAILVHGCFWHGHDCPMFRMPATRREFWATKIASNRARDGRAITGLSAAGWRVLVVWECALKGPARRPLDSVLDEIASWLKTDAPSCTLEGNGVKSGQAVKLAESSV